MADPVGDDAGDRFAADCYCGVTELFDQFAVDGDGQFGFASGRLAFRRLLRGTFTGGPGRVWRGRRVGQHSGSDPAGRFAVWRQTSVFVAHSPILSASLRKAMV